jgi:hypothetical protein
MTRSLLPALFLFATACGSAAGPKRPTTGTGGDGEEGGSGGSGGGGKSGTGGSPGKPDAMPAPEHDAAAPDSAAADAGPPGTADCMTAGAGSLFCNTLQTLPRTIKETGLFPMAPDFSKRPASLREYAPDPALWSDGLEKQRFLLLPQGTKIDNTKPRQWDFPIGTVFIKTFFDDGPAGPRPVETRFIRRIGGPDAFEQYDYNVYQWNAAGTDATLVEIEGLRTPVMVTVKKLGAPFSHDIPSRQDCGACHDANAKVAQTFIGFDEIRLNSKLTPASARTQLEDFTGLFTSPPPKPAELTDADPRLLRIKRFVLGNCVHCHNGSRVVDLRPESFVANTVGKPIDASGITPPAGWLRVVPAKPEMSILYVEARRTMLPSGLKPMPPVCLAVAETGALEDLRAWIMSLPPK